MEWWRSLKTDSGMSFSQTKRAEPLSPLDLGLLCVVTLLPCLVVPWLHDPFLAGKDILFKCAMFAAASIAVFRHKSGTPVALPTWAVVCLILFCLSVFTTMPLARQKEVALVSAEGFLAWMIGMVFLRSRLKDPALLPRIVQCVVIVGVLQTAIGFYQTGILFNPTLFFSRANKLAFSGTFGNPDYVASWLAMALFLNLYGTDTLGVSGNARPWASFILASGLLLTRSRGAWVSFLIVWGLLEIFKRKEKEHNTRIVLLAVTLSLVLVGLGVWGILADSSHGFLTSFHTLRGRGLIWACSLHAFKTSMGLGVGLDNLQFHFFDAQKTLFQSGEWERFTSNASMIQRAHNEYLDFLVEGGVFFLAAWLLFIAIQLKTIWKERANAQGLPFAGVVLYGCVVSLVSFPFHIVPNRMLFGIASSVILGFRDETETLPLNVSTAMKWLGGLLCLMAVMQESRPVMFQSHFYNAEVALAARQFAAAEDHLQKAMAYAPHDSELSLLKARLLYRRFKSKEALLVIERAEARGKTIDLLKLKGLVLLDLGEWMRAKAVYEDLSQAYPLHITPHYQLGRIYLKLHEREKAMQEFERAAQLKPMSAKAKAEQARARLYLQGVKKDEGNRLAAALESF